MERNETGKRGQGVLAGGERAMWFYMGPEKASLRGWYLSRSLKEMKNIF